MKLIYVVIDGMGDLPIEELDNMTPLEAAETPNMDLLARRGVTGLMYTVGKGIAPESDVAVTSILGYDPFKYYTGRGPVEAFGSGLTLRYGDLALRCNFATLGLGDVILDRRVGRGLSNEEAAELSKALNDEIKLESHPADFEFRNTVSYRGVLVIKSRVGPLSDRITNTDPVYSKKAGLGVAKAVYEMVLKRSKPTQETEKALISAKLVNEFVQKGHVTLERHDVNKRRVAKGKLKANVIITRDAGNHLPDLYDINKRYGVRFVCLADMPVEKGLARLAGMHLFDLPPPSHDLERDYRLRMEKLFEVLPNYDCIYVHIKGTDEPAHDGNALLKAQHIAEIDRNFFGELLSRIDLESNIICVTADHSTPCKLKAHSDDPVPLLISGDGIQGDFTQRFSEEECRKGSLGVLTHGTELMPMLIAYIQ